MKRYVLILLVLVAASCSNSGNENASVATAQKASTQTNTTAAPTQSQARYSSISPAQADMMIKQRKDLLIVDVRSPEELRQGRLQNSILIPFWNVMKGNHNLPKDKPILLVCAVGGRSYGAMQVLARQGYQELYNLSGGMSAWQKARLPIVY